MDSFPRKPILLAALGMFGVILFVMIGVGGLGLFVLGFTRAQHGLPTNWPVAATCLLVGVVSLWLAYIALRSAVQRIKEAQQVAVARRAIWEASFRASTDRGAGSSAGK